jgi:outer membrane protein assembly factor BamA
MSELSLWGGMKFRFLPGLKPAGMILVLALLAACSPARRVPQGEYLLDRNVIKVDDAKAEVGDVESIIKQTPNKRLLFGIRFHLRMYNASSGGKDNKLKEKVRTIVGEAPVILDTSLAELSTRQMQIFLRNAGYLNAGVTHEVKAGSGLRKNRARVIYNLSPRERYMVGDFNQKIADTTMKSIYLNSMPEALISTGQPFDAELLDDERDRITRLFRENGFYYFLPEFIYYRADTSMGNHKVGLQMVIDDLAFPDVDIPWQKQCFVQNVFVHVDPNEAVPGALPDTTVYYDKTDSSFTRVYFITYNKEYFKSTIARCVFLRVGGLYNISDAEQSYTRLSELRNFKYINIRFSRLDNATDSMGMVALKCDIFLTPMMRQDYSIETEGTVTAGDPGIAASLVYRNRNLMKGAEILSLRLYTALEVQNLPDFQGSEEVLAGLPFNTVETGLDFNLEVPKFLVPFPATNFPKYFRPKSSIKVGIHYQKRPDYIRYITTTNYGYQWRQNRRLSHTLTPVELSSIKIFPDSLFAIRINALKDPKLKMQYRDHLIAASNYSLVYSNQQIDKRKDFSYARFSMEAAGNMLRLFNALLGSEMQNDDYYTLFNIRYAQYLRFSLDMRHFHYPSPTTTLGFRSILGIGLPYGNLNVLPFEKSFYAGGANGIRAFPLRTLGPGSYHDTTGLQIDRSGDISFESSIEYRFKIYRYFEGAAFIDAGNIWLAWPSPDYSGGDFQFSRFYKEIAFGTGLGLRVDFSFFVIRLDAGLPIKDPSLPEGQRWQFASTRFSDINWNVAIGYPF